MKPFAVLLCTLLLVTSLTACGWVTITDGPAPSASNSAASDNDVAEEEPQPSSDVVVTAEDVQSAVEALVPDEYRGQSYSCDILTASDGSGFIVSLQIDVDTEDAADMKRSLNKLKNALASIDRIPTVESPLAGQDIGAIRENLPKVKALAEAYQASGTSASFYEFTCEYLWQQYAAQMGITAETPGYDQYRQAFLEGGGSEAAKGLAAIYDSWSSDPEAFEFLLDHSDTIDDLLDQLNTTTSGVSDALEQVAGPTAAVVGKLADLCGDMDDLTDLLDDADDLSAAIRHSSKKLRSILDSTDDLRTILNNYEPTAQETLKTLEDLSVTAAATVRDSEQLASDAEALLKASGTQLDAGTKQTLSGLAAALRQAASGLATTNEVKEAKSSINSIIEDTWNEHTGDIDNLLNMDATAETISLTSPENPAPQSIQVIIRSQEIKAEEQDTEEAAKASPDKGTFWSRVAQMFKDFWAAITGIFH